ncbi:MAG: hypothetical protein WA996_13660 [Candidatus Promineifilaceae bacterium]
MAKKVRRVRRRVKEEESAKPKKGPVVPVEEQLREEYAYVMQDLRRVFVLASLLFVLLIALNLLLG